MTKKIGRPRKPASTILSRTHSVRFTPTEDAMIRKASRKEKERPATWIALYAVSSARKVLLPAEDKLA